MKKAWLILTIHLATCVVGILVGELYLRMKGYPSYVRTFPGQYLNRPGSLAWAQPDAELGWTANKTSPETNAEGFRNAKDFHDVELNTCKTRIMVLGDSFMYGAVGRTSETVPSLLQARLGPHYEVFNVSVPAWGIDQMYLAYRRHRDLLHPHIVMLAFIDDDVWRVLEAYRRYEGLNKPSFFVNHGDLVPRTEIDEKELLMNEVMGNSVLLSLVMRELYRVTVARPLVTTIFRRMAQETLQRNEQFIVLRIPNKEHESFIGHMIWRLRSFSGVLDSTHAQYLEAVAAFRGIPAWGQDLYQPDGHLAASGNQHIADFISRRFLNVTMGSTIVGSD